MDPEAGRLRALAEEFGVGDRLRLVGAVPRPAVPDLIRAVDVVVAVPWYEPFGIVPLEAMACGRPVVAAAVGGLLDTVVPGVTGLLVPARDPASLASALTSLVDDPALRARLGRQAAERARSRYAWPRIAAAHARTYAALRRARGATPQSLSLLAGESA
jgi:glycosyltransferase involved in cell wall biosynthesis